MYFYSVREAPFGHSLTHQPYNYLNAKIMCFNASFLISFSIAYNGPLPKGDNAMIPQFLAAGTFEAGVTSLFRPSK